MVMGITLHLHLMGHDHPKAHDAEHCSICQQLVIAPGKFMTEPESGLPDFNPQKNSVEFQSKFCIVAFHFEPFGPRPPPLLEKS